MSEKLKVLFLPKWYPNQTDPQLGIFVQKHAKAVAKYAEVVVLYAAALDKIKNNKSFEVVENTNNGFLEIIIYYKKNTLQFRQKYAHISNIMGAFRYCFANWKGLKIVWEKVGRPDISHVHILTRPALVAFYLEKKYKIPFFITEHWSGYLTKGFAQKNRLSRFFAKYLATKAKIVTAVSPHLQKEMVKKGIKPVQAIIPNVIDIDENKIPNFSLKNELGESVKIIKILSVADLVDEVKNISDALNVIAQIVDNQKLMMPYFEYHIIGGGVDEMRLRALAANLDLLDKYVFFHGRQKNDYVLNFMQNVDFVLINSNYETFSVVTAEALSMGKPVIATRCGGPELFINVKTGILIDTKNPSQLQAAILQMLQNYKDYDPIFLQNTIRNRFSSDKIGRQFCDIYKSILQAQTR